MTDFLQALGSIFTAIAVLILVIAVFILGLWPIWLGLAAIKYLLT